MRAIKNLVISIRWISSGFLFLTFLTSVIILNAQSTKDISVKLVRVDDKHKVDVFINGSLFTSYQYPENIEKPFLFPVNAPDGSVITRGYPIEPRKGERMDHPHHIGIWFNHGNVNGLDFWNNSSAIAAEKKDDYGHIVHQKIVKAESGKIGMLEVIMNWDDSKGNTLLTENTRYIFSGDKNSRTIDHITVQYLPRLMVLSLSTIVKKAFSLSGLTGHLKCLQMNL
ncbi:MAG: DUF6807 family protein [Bacteroidales bacterium]|jgi:hypothetical protein